MTRNNFPSLATASSVELICAALIEPEPIRFIWLNWLATGKFHMLAGPPATGKTTLAMSIVAAISSGGFGGRGWPDKTFVPCGNVVIWSGEDDIEDTLTPRLIAAGADMSRVFIIRGTSKNGCSRPFNPETDFALLPTKLREIGNVLLVVIDPVVMIVAGDSHKNSDVRKGLAPVISLGEEFGCAVLGISHVTKNSKGKEPLDRVAGSLGFGAASRCVWLVAKDKSASSSSGLSNCVLVRAKSNIGPDDGGFGYHIESAVIETNQGQIATSRVRWNETPIVGAAIDILKIAEGGNGNAESGKLNEAVGFLETILANGPLAYPDVEAQALSAGMSKATIRRAKQQLGVRHHKQSGAGQVSPFVWSLPASAAVPPWQPASLPADLSVLTSLSAAASYLVSATTAPTLSSQGGLVELIDLTDRKELTSSADTDAPDSPASPPVASVKLGYVGELPDPDDPDYSGELPDPDDPGYPVYADDQDDADDAVESVDSVALYEPDDLVDPADLVYPDEFVDPDDLVDSDELVDQGGPD